MPAVFPGDPSGEEPPAKVDRLPEMLLGLIEPLVLQGDQTQVVVPLGVAVEKVDEEAKEDLGLLVLPLL